MPITPCNHKGKSGYKWGQQGKCYTGPGGKVRALRQAKAIQASKNPSVRNARNPMRLDPTRTGTLRRALVNHLRKLFSRIKRKIVETVVKQDAFGKLPRPANPLLINTRWKFLTSPEQVRAFQSWLKNELGQGLTNPTLEQLLRRYVEDGLRKGAGRSFDDVRSGERSLLSSQEQLAGYQGSKEEFLRSAFNRPVAVEKVALLAGRVFDDLQNITSDMATRISRVLTDGLVQGKGPRDIARDMTKQVDISRGRAETIARTEIIRAHAEGQLVAMKDLGVEQVGVMVEWRTAGDDRVCPSCGDMEGVVLTLEEAQGMIPLHPNCRCAWIPANVGEDTSEQTRDKGDIEFSIGMAAGRLGEKTETEDQAPWAGPDAEIAEERPVSILDLLRDLL